MVEQMMSKGKQGLVVILYKPYRLRRTDNSKCLDNIHSKGSFCPFQTWLDNCKIDKKQFGEYWVYEIATDKVMLEDVNIDGNVYAVDCKIQCKGSVNISTQLFVTKNATVDPQLGRVLSPIEWNTKIHYEVPLQLQQFEHEKEITSKKRLFSKSLVFLQHYLQFAIELFGLDNPYVAIGYNMIGNIYSDKGDYDRAVEFHEKALKVMLDIFGVNYPIVAQLYHNLAKASKNNGHNDKSIAYYEKSLQIRLSIFGARHSDVAQLYNNLGNIYKNKGDDFKAIEYHKLALKIRTEIFGNANQDTGDSYWNLGLVFEQKQEIKISLEYYEDAWKAYSTPLGEWHTETLQAKEKVKRLSGML
ncbi:hypothetical protein RFI_18300 [Reticulomyxa filosa]|uniref:Uncharacterized protein n=1 Tax=Reticulomyxa filosa TaxID=46433 RepID=X6MZP8_RETFI|nr:hypothetical protein RFI_18300 [Reticulomyxa filosa]|eukprot:ETO18944.1 hypothetical protein RFI_18300 [Reticulomyxa filosa]